MITAFSISLPFQDLKVRASAPVSDMLADTSEAEPSDGIRRARMPELELKTDCVLDEEVWAV